MDSANHPFVEGCQSKIKIAERGIEQINGRSWPERVGEMREQTQKRFAETIAVYQDALQEFYSEQLKLLDL
jgi:hypothetical protein